MQKLEDVMRRAVHSGKPERETLSRRVMLRGALAAGCSLWVPMLLSGCDSKKGADSTSPAPAAPPATSAKPAAPAATAGKVAQATVQYQLQPKGDQKCSNCVHFIAESNTCMLVDGQISPVAWCSLWVKKA